MAVEALAESLVAAVERDGADGVRACLLRVSDFVRNDGKNLNGVYPLRFAAIARHLGYLALALGEKQRAGTARRLQPQWIALQQELGRYFGRYPTLAPLLSQAASDDALESFAGLSTRKQGSRDRLLYATIILLIVDLFERDYGSVPDNSDQSDEGEAELRFDRSFLDFALPEGERDLPERLRAELLNVLSTPGRQRAISPAHPTINVGFTFKAENLPRLRNFVDYFASPEDGGAHFICYRPRYENSNELIKSFIAIKPPERRGQEAMTRNKVSFGFVHVYEQRTMGAQLRISLGEVLPLDDGLCFVGGQRVRRPEHPLTTLPLSALKVIAIPWNSVENFESVFSGLVMSATYQRRHLVSCLALRATPIHHSSLVDVHPVRLDKLQENLTADAAVEATMPGYGPKFILDAASTAKRIAALTNNDPTKWEVPANYHAVAPSDAERAALERHEVDRATAALGTFNNPRFVDAAGAAFSFWTGLRFGPLVAKE